MTEPGVLGDLKWKSRELMVEEAVHNSDLQGHPWNADSRGGVQRQRSVCFISQRGCCPRCWEVTISDRFMKSGYCAILCLGFQLFQSLLILHRMGIEILSFTIKDVYDNVTYLQVHISIHKYSSQKDKSKNSHLEWLEKFLLL